MSAIAATLLLSLLSPLQLPGNSLQILPALTQRTGDRQSEADRLFQKGVQQFRQGQFREALLIYQQVLEIQRAIADRVGEGATLDNIGEVYVSLSQYSQALEVLQQALEIRQSTGNQAGEGETLNNLGVVYLNLGQNDRAMELLNRALVIHRKIGDRSGEGTVLNSMGTVYHRQNQSVKALDFYQQALAIHRQINDRLGEGVDLSGIGAVYQQQGQDDKALESYQQALIIHREVGDKVGEGVALTNLGAVSQQLGQDSQALESYQQALVIIKETGDRQGEGITLGNLGFLLNHQNQPELAISFYKQSINIIETIRQDLRSLSKEQQQSFAETVASNYRALADLLLHQGRVSEAQQLLDLLKIKEINNYLQIAPGDFQKKQKIENLPQEQIIQENYAGLQDRSIQLGQELTQLREITPTERSPQEQQRIQQLESNLQQMRRQFNEFIRTPEIVALVQQIQTTSGQQNLNLTQLNSLRDNLRRLQQNAVLLYPLILEDRLELVLVSPDIPPIHRSVPVKRQVLEAAIADFRIALVNPEIDAKSIARQLYDWLIKPIESDLSQAEAKTIIYAPDGKLRYLPLAALFDGERWLTERFRINHITAATLSEFNTKPQGQLKILAAALTTGNYNFIIGNRKFELAGLPFAGREVENLAATIPGTTKLIDRDFNRSALVSRMNDYNVVHLATHSAFLSGDPENSFILLGDGDRLTFQDIQTWSLPNVDMVVLSGCQTGVGGIFGNGEEILGFGYQMQETGARAAIASLWAVDDGGTQALMDAFYAALQKDNITKAEALQIAQNALITGDYTAIGDRRGIAIVQRIRSTLPPNVESHLSHPYYWAPFILIGNGL